MTDLRRELWQVDELFFGEEGYTQVTMLIVRAVLERFRTGHDATLDMDDDLYAVLRENKLIKYSYLFDTAGIKRVTDIGQIWDEKRDFGLKIGSVGVLV